MWCFNVESSEYHFYMDTKILQDLQICINVPFFKCLNILGKKTDGKEAKRKNKKTYQSQSQKKKS